MKKALLLCALGAAVGVLAATPARADDFTLTFSGNTNPLFPALGAPISGSLTFDATLGYSGGSDHGAITDLAGTVTISGTTYNVTGTDDGFNGAGDILFEDGPNNFSLAGTIGFTGYDGLGINLQNPAPNVDLYVGFLDEQACTGNGGSCSIFSLPYYMTSDTITDTSDTTPPSPTPEPGSLALLGTAILGGAGALRRRFIS